MLNKISKMFSVNSQTLTILVCMLILSPVISDGVTINFEKNYDMVDQEGNEISYMPSDGGKSGPKDGLYFVNGKWFDQFSALEGSDGRIAEFHSYVAGFVSVPGLEVKGIQQNHVLYLNAPSRVLIFYPNQPPQIGQSQASLVKMEKTKFDGQRIKVDFESLIGENPEIYTKNNSLPFTQVSNPINNESAGSLFFYEKLKKLFDKATPEKTLAKGTPKYDAVREKFYTDDYQREVTKAMADFYVLQNPDNFRVRNLRETNQTDIEKRDKIFEIFLKNLNPEDQVYKDFYNILNYLCQKTLRNFFFGPNSNFLRLLFKDLESDNSNLDVQFEKNIKDLGPEILFDFETAPFFVRDMEFEDLLLGSDDNKITPLENNQAFYRRKRLKIINAFEQLISEYTKYLPDGASEVKFNGLTAVIKNYDSVNFFFGLMERSYFPKLFEHYMNGAKSLLKSTKLYDGLNAQDTSEGILKIRSFFLLYGYIDRDENNFPTDTPIYHPAKIFDTGRRMILI